jgi:uncharacterized protein
MVPVGFTLQPELEFLERLDELIVARADYYEVAPETLWREDAHGRLGPNGYHRRFAALRARTGKFFVAHGVGVSLGTAADGARLRRWLARVAADARTFRFRWYSDHLGATSLAGLATTLPLPLPMNARAAHVVRRRLRAMQRVVRDVGVENNVAYFLLGDALEEPAWLSGIVAAPRMHVVLDLHNVFTMAQNFRFDPDAYVERLDLSRVIELHLSGGADSDPAWLPSGRVLRLDSHDARVPEEVWALYERWAPRCPRLRGVTLERMEGTVTDADVPVLVDEIERARDLARRLA